MTLNTAGSTSVSTVKGLVAVPNTFLNDGLVLIRFHHALSCGREESSTQPALPALQDPLRGQHYICCTVSIPAERWSCQAAPQLHPTGHAAAPGLLPGPLHPVCLVLVQSNMWSMSLQHCEQLTA